jgi:hypothetical protein
MNQENVQQKIADFIDGASECACQLFETGDVSGQLGNLLEQTEATIRKYPVKSAIAGLVSGFVIGKILR